MIKRPTVVPTVEAGGSLPTLGTDPYFAIFAGIVASEAYMTRRSSLAPNPST